MSVIAVDHDRPNPLQSAGVSGEPVIGAAGKANSGSSMSAIAEQQAALRRLITTYKAKLAQGQSAGQLAALRQQITAAAKALGQNIQLPKPPKSDSSEVAGSPATAGYGNKPLSILA